MLALFSRWWGLASSWWWTRRHPETAVDDSREQLVRLMIEARRSSDRILANISQPPKGHTRHG